MKRRKATLLLIVSALLPGMLFGCGSAARSAEVQVTVQQAQATVLEHAGFTDDQITGLRTEFDVDDGIPSYEIEFRQGDYVYDYTVHAGTGDILEWDRDYEPPRHGGIPS